MSMKQGMSLDKQHSWQTNKIFVTATCHDILLLTHQHHQHISNTTLIKFCRRSNGISFFNGAFHSIALRVDPGALWEHTDVVRGTSWTKRRRGNRGGGFLLMSTLNRDLIKSCIGTDRFSSAKARTVCNSVVWQGLHLI